MKYDPDELRRLADEIVYTCDRPMFDDMIGEEYAPKYEGKVAERMRDFDPNNDVVAYYGDSNIFGLMIMWLADNFEGFDVARYSSRAQAYIVREFSHDKFTRQEQQEPQEPQEPQERQEQQLDPSKRPQPSIRWNWSR